MSDKSSSESSSSGSASPMTPKDETHPVISSSVPPPKLDFYADPFATEEENLVLYSHAVYEYTRQLWIETRRRAEIEYGIKRQRERERSPERRALAATHARKRSAPAAVYQG